MSHVQLLSFENGGFGGVKYYSPSYFLAYIQSDILILAKICQANYTCFHDNDEYRITGQL